MNKPNLNLKLLKMKGSNLKNLKY